MSIYFSAKTGGFYKTSIHKVFPEDIVSISEETYNQLLQGQSCGKQIAADASGAPILVDKKDSLLTWNQIRMIRDSLISETDWSQLSDISEVTKAKWAAYRQALRDIPQKFTSPDLVIWPEHP